MSKVADVELGVDWSAHFPIGRILTCASGYDSQANRTAVHGEGGSLELSHGKQTPKLAESQEQFNGMLDAFALAIRENREPRTASGLEGLQDMRIMDL